MSDITVHLSAAFTFQIYIYLHVYIFQIYVMSYGYMYGQRHRQHAICVSGMVVKLDELFIKNVVGEINTLLIPTNSSHFLETDS